MDLVLPLHDRDGGSEYQGRPDRVLLVVREDQSNSLNRLAHATVPSISTGPSDLRVRLDSPHLVSQDSSCPGSCLLLHHPVQALELEGQQLLSETVGLLSCGGGDDGHRCEIVPAVDELGVVRFEEYIVLLRLCPRR